MSDASSSNEPFFLARYNPPLLEEQFKKEGEPDFHHVFGPVGTINIFTGANNSGKSWAMRQLFMGAPGLLSQIGEVVPAIRLQNLIDEFLPMRDRLNEVRIYLGDALNKEKIQWFRDEIQKQSLPYFLTDANRKFQIELEKPLDTLISGLDQVVSEKLFYEAAILASSGFTQSPNKVVIQGIVAFNILDSVISNFKGDKSWEFRNNITPEVDSINLFYLDLLKNWFSKLRRFLEGLLLSEANIMHTYIPTLRSLHSITNSEGKRIDEDNHQHSVKANYFSKSNRFDRQFWQTHKISTGQSLYWDVLEARNGTAEQRKNLEEFEKFITDQFYPNQGFSLTAKVNLEQLRNHNRENKAGATKQNEHHLLVKIGDTEKEIHNLGDGIQSIIMLTFPIFNAKSGSMIFIEEPELHMHPGLQRQFLEALSRPEVVAKKLTFFITTHSNHLVDLMLTQQQDISLFKFKEGENGKKIIQHVESGDHSILRELGVQNSSVFLANCSIWVEGPTDRMYIRAYLKAYVEAHEELRMPKEDLDFSFFEYAGSNLAHYAFAKVEDLEDEIENIKALRLSNRIMVVADQDKGKDGKHGALNILVSANFSYHYFENSREVENLLDLPTLKLALPEAFPKTKDKVNSLEDPDPKEYLGKYLEDKLGDGAFAPTDILQSGTFSGSKKVKLCKAAIGHIEWDTMTDDAKALAKAVFSFITRH